MLVAMFGAFSWIAAVRPDRTPSCSSGDRHSLQSRKQPECNAPHSIDQNADHRQHRRRNSCRWSFQLCVNLALVTTSDLESCPNVNSHLYSHLDPAWFKPPGSTKYAATSSGAFKAACSVSLGSLALGSLLLRLIHLTLAIVRSITSRSERCFLLVLSRL